MADLRSRRFRLVWGLWALWILLLGLSLIFVHAIYHVGSVSEYLWAFVILDMPSSWCPTFLSLYGFAALAAFFLVNPKLKKISGNIAMFAGLVLLPVGIYATIEFTAQQAFAFSFDYLYPQAIHVSEVLTGLLTIYLWRKG